MVDQLSAGANNLFARYGFRKKAGAFFGVPLQIADKLDEETFEGIVIARARGGFFGSLDPSDQGLRGAQGTNQVVGEFAAMSGGFGHQRDFGDEIVDFGTAM